MISGSWDFAGVLFALSGFLLIGGPLVLEGLNRTGRSLWLRSEADSAQTVGEYWWFIRVALWALYFAALAACSIFLLWKRARTTSIYNVDPPAFDEALAGVLNRLPVHWARARNRVFIAFPASPDGLAKEESPPVVRGSPDPALGATSVVRGSPDPALGATAGLLETEADARSGQSTGAAQPRPDPRRAQAPEIMSQEATSVLALDPFPAMRHVTLQWPPEAGPWRQEIEAELANTLLVVHTRDNPAGLWLMSIGSTLLCVIFFSLALLVFLSFLRPMG
jgi:hypothetical protein